MRKIQKVFYIFLISIFILSFFSIGQASAQMVHCGLTDTSDSGGRPACTLCDFFVMLDGWVTSILTTVLPVLAGLMIAIGGIYYLFSRGDPEKLNSAKKVFVSVGIGLLIAYSAWLIVNMFFLVIGINRWEGFGGGWWQIDCTTTQQQSSSSSNCLSCTASSGVECTAAICSGLGDCNFTEGPVAGTGFCIPNY